MSGYPILHHATGLFVVDMKKNNDVGLFAFVCLFSAFSEGNTESSISINNQLLSNKYKKFAFWELFD